MPEVTLSRWVFKLLCRWACLTCWKRTQALTLAKAIAVLNIPQQLILPDTVHEGIVINSAERCVCITIPKGTNTTCTANQCYRSAG